MTSEAFDIAGRRRSRVTAVASCTPASPLVTTATFQPVPRSDVSRACTPGVSGGKPASVSARGRAATLSLFPWVRARV